MAKETKVLVTMPDPHMIDAALSRGRAALADLGSFESAEVIRSQRKGRDARDQRR